MSDNAFLAGYGAAQAVPGPLFTFAAYLGAVVKSPPNGILGATIGLVGIFLPGMLILLGTLPFWDRFRSRLGAQAAMRGINADRSGSWERLFIIRCGRAPSITLQTFVWR